MTTDELMALAANCEDDTYALHDAQAAGASADVIVSLRDELRADRKRLRTALEAVAEGYRQEADRAKASGARVIELMQHATSLMEERDRLRMVMEIIALGDSKDPVRDATSTLVDMGIWRADAGNAARRTA